MIQRKYYFSIFLPSKNGQKRKNERAENGISSGVQESHSTVHKEITHKLTAAKHPLLVKPTLCTDFWWITTQGTIQTYITKIDIFFRAHTKREYGPVCLHDHCAAWPSILNLTSI